MRYYTYFFVTKNCSSRKALIFYLAVFVLFVTNCVISVVIKICSKVTELQLDVAVSNSSLKILQGSRHNSLSKDCNVLIDEMGHGVKTISYSKMKLTLIV